MRKLLSLMGISTALMSSKSALAEYGLNMTQGVTSTSQDIYDLHMLIFWVCVVIGVVVVVVVEIGRASCRERV